MISRLKNFCSGSIFGSLEDISSRWESDIDEVGGVEHKEPLKFMADIYSFERFQESQAVAASTPNPVVLSPAPFWRKSRRLSPRTAHQTVNLRVVQYVFVWYIDLRLRDNWVLICKWGPPSMTVFDERTFSFRQNSRYPGRMITFASVCGKCLYVDAWYL